jgi:hypothetical protein
MNGDLDRYYRILGLAPGASLRAVKAAHRDLVKRWHPDQFAGDVRLREQAEARIKEINDAWDQLREVPPVPVAAPGSASGVSGSARIHRGRARWSAPPVFWLALAAALLVTAVAVLRVSRESFDAAARSAARSPSRAELAEARVAEIEERLDAAAATGDGLHQGYLQPGLTKEQVLAVQGPPTAIRDFWWAYNFSRVHFNASGRVSSWYDSPAGQRLKVPPITDVTAEGQFFTIGSTKDHVLKVQGPPTRFGDTEWSYGFSQVTFDGEGRVTSWSDAAAGQGLRVRLVPSSGVPPSRDHLAIGATKDEVLAVQGTPTELTDARWSYRFSTISFDSSGRVTSWYDSPAGYRLRLRPGE